VRNALNAAARAMREEPTDQEPAGGACAKMCAPRKIDSTQWGLNNEIFERCNAVVGAIITGAAAL
jgi:hypothetical protein